MYLEISILEHVCEEDSVFNKIFKVVLDVKKFKNY